MLLLLVSSAAAANPVTVSIVDLSETPGNLTVTVNAIDGTGRSLTNLTPANFRASFNDAQLNITDVQASVSEEKPVSVLMLVDTSGSMYGERIDKERSAVDEFISQLKPADRVAVMSFASSVTPLQDFTTDHALLSQAVSKLQARGDTALYTAVIAATKAISAEQNSQRLILLLSDGENNVASDQKNASLAAAKASGASVIAIGLGAEVDSQYLAQLAQTSGGHVLEAQTASDLRDEYSQLAKSIRSQYILTIKVPASVDRTVNGTLKVYATVDADSAFAERELAPLEGAVPPPFALSVTGIAAGQRLTGSLALNLVAPKGHALVSAQYLVDDNVLHTSDTSGLGFSLDPASLQPGSHTLKVVGKDSTGSIGEAEVPFITVAPPAKKDGGGGFSVPVMPILALLAVGAVGFLVVTFVRRRSMRTPSYESRIKPWADRTMPDTPTQIMDWPERETRVEAAKREPAGPERPLGRLIVMHEASVREGQLNAIQEYDLFSSPLTFGTGASCDVQVEDTSGAIAAEEARLWVQRGRLVYHKLTTLSAMATEGVTSGWQFLESGEDLRIGAYRLLFQLMEPEVIEQPVEQEPAPRTQEHGMSLRPSWQSMPAVPDDPSLRHSTE
jgi:VWFA-related protein